MTEIDDTSLEELHAVALAERNGEAFTTKETLVHISRDLGTDTTASSV